MRSLLAQATEVQRYRGAICGRVVDPASFLSLSSLASCSSATPTPDSPPAPPGVCHGVGVIGIPIESDYDYGPNEQVSMHCFPSERVAVSLPTGANVLDSFDGDYDHEDCNACLGVLLLLLSLSQSPDRFPSTAGRASLK